MSTKKGGGIKFTPPQDQLNVVPFNHNHLFEIELKVVIKY